MKLEIKDEGVERYTIDTIDLADRLNEIANDIVLADVAVAGLAKEHGIKRDPASDALRRMLYGLKNKLIAIANEIHHDPTELHEAEEGGAS